MLDRVSLFRLGKSVLAQADGPLVARRLVRVRGGALLLVLLFGALACGRPERKAGDPITIWSSNNPPEVALVEWAANRPGPTGLKALTQPIPEGRSSEEVVLAAVVGGTTPDVYANMWQGSVAMYAESEVLVALDTLDGFLPWLQKRCSPATIAEVTAPNGHIYQVPWKVNPIVTMYNLALFGEDLPRSYADFLAAGARLKGDLDQDGYIDRFVGYTAPHPIWYERLFNFYPLFLAASDGAPLVQDGRAAFNRPEAVAVFAFLRKLYAQNYFTRDQFASGRDPFLDGRIGSRWTGPWSISYTKEYAPEGFEFAFGPMLVPETNAAAHGSGLKPGEPEYASGLKPGEPVAASGLKPGEPVEVLPFTYGDPKNIVIFRTAPDAQAAWDFLEAGLLSDEGDLRLLSTSSQLPRREDLLSNPLFAEYFNAHPSMRAFARQADRVTGVPAEPLIVEVFDIISQEYEACVLYGAKSPEDAIRDAAEAVDVLLAANRQEL